MVNEKPLTRNEQPIFYALRFQLTTLNGTWDKGHGTKRQRLANGEQKLLNPQPVTRNPFLRFAHHASRSTHNSQRATLNPISGLTPLLPVIFTLCALRFTLPTNFGANTPPTRQFHALRITLLLVPRPSPLVPFRDVIFVTVNSKMAKMAGK